MANESNFHALKPIAFLDPARLDRLLNEVPPEALRLGSDVDGKWVTLANLEGTTLEDVVSAIQTDMAIDAGNDEDLYSNVTIADFVGGGTVRSAVIRWFALIASTEGYDGIHVDVGLSRIYPLLGVRHDVLKRGVLSPVLEAVVEEECDTDDLDNTDDDSVLSG